MYGITVFTKCVIFLLNSFRMKLSLYASYHNTLEFHNQKKNYFNIPGNDVKIYNFPFIFFVINVHANIREHGVKKHSLSFDFYVLVILGN
jgi:hypothetical protein